MAIIDIPWRQASMPAPPRKAVANWFSPPKTSSALSSFSSHLPPATPSHTMSESMMEENIENAEELIKKWDPNGSSFHKFISLFQENRKEAKEFIKCVKDLRRAMHFLVSQHSTSSKLVLAQNLMQIAMKRLEKEFYMMLSTNREHLDPESVSSRSSHLSRSLSLDSSDEGHLTSDEEIQAAGESISEVEKLAVLVMSDLRTIAESMAISGYGMECIKIYKLNRKSIVDEALYRLGVERHTSSQFNKMSSDTIDQHVKRWLNAAKVSVKTLFHGERFLCDHVFSASDTIRETCFTHIVQEGAIQLFRFPEIVAKSKRSQDKIFQLMDLHEAVSELWPDIESIFSYESVSAVKLQALSSIHKLSEAVRSILSEFESSIQKNSSRVPIPGGGIHPLTSSVLDYVTSLGNYSGVLSDILTDSVSHMQSPFPESYFQSPHPNETPTSAVSVRLAWLILVLLCKLDSKAELYSDTALSYLFLANNLQFVLQKVQTTTLKYLLGDDWVAKLDRKVKLYAANYEVLAWTRVFSCLPLKLSEPRSAADVKEHFRQFDAAFEEAYKKQASWVVPDAKLRDEIKLSLARKLVPAYREFYDTNVAILGREKNLEVLVRHSPDNLGNYLSDLFHGIAVSESSSSSQFRSSRCLL